MKFTETMTREERRDAIRATTANRDHLIAIHQTSSSPAETVAQLIGRIGYQAARETIAEAVNARGDWDERISDTARAWAATIDTAADRETLLAHYLTTDAIHPAHVDQIARAAAEYDAEKPDCASAYEYRRIRWALLDKIAQDHQGRALAVCLVAHDAERMQKITNSQHRQIMAIYDAWERGWCALEASEAQQPEGADLDAQSARVEAATAAALAGAGVLAEEPAQDDAEPLRVFERAGVISDLKVEPMTAAQVAEASAALDAAEAASQEAAPAAEEAPEPQRTTYISSSGDGTTTSAAEALSWHRAGDDLIIYHPGRPAGYLHGAPQEAPQEEDENRAHCKRIAEEIDAYVNDEVKRCPACGEIHRRDWGDVGDVFRCPSCGNVSSVDDWEWLRVHDFLEDCLDIEYRVSGRARDALRSVCFMVACGGPNIYLDTETKNVELYWWSERAWFPMSSEACEALDEYAAEIWGCM